MIEAVVNTLPEILKKHICTLKRASFDETNGIFMCESEMKVVHFDKIPKDYARGRGWDGVPSSNDALYITSRGKWYFIEFKNGTVKKEQIFRKIYDSLIMLLELKIIPDIDFIRKNISYILVYNSGKAGKIPESSGRVKNYSYVFNWLNKKKSFLGLKSLKNIYFVKRIHMRRSFLKKNLLFRWKCRKVRKKYKGLRKPLLRGLSKGCEAAVLLSGYFAHGGQVVGASKDGLNA